MGKLHDRVAIGFQQLDLKQGTGQIYAKADIISAGNVPSVKRLKASLKGALLCGVNTKLADGGNWPIEQY